MGKLEAYIKEHPITVAVIAVVGVIAVLLLSRGGGASASPASSVAAATLQEQQIQAGVAVQNAQVGAQQQATQLAAQVQNNNTNAALSAQNTQVEASLIAALAGNQTTAQSNVLSANVLNNQYSLEAGVLNHQTDAAVDVANTQANLAEYAYNQASQLQNENLAAILPYVTKINGSQNRLSLLQTLAGNPYAANTAAQGQTTSDVSGDSLLSSLTKSIAGFAAGL